MRPEDVMGTFEGQRSPPAWPIHPWSRHKGSRTGGRWGSSPLLPSRSGVEMSGRGGKSRSSVAKHTQTHVHTRAHMHTREDKVIAMSACPSSTPKAAPSRLLSILAVALVTLMPAVGTVVMRLVRAESRVLRNRSHQV